MKRFFLNIIVLFCASNMWAQLDESALVDSYGAIRAAMVRDVCSIVGFKDEAILRRISNSNLDEFEKLIEGEDTLCRILATSLSLNGTDVSVYHQKLRDIRRNFQYQLGQFFPEKETQIESVFRKYIAKIDKLTEECNTFNSDTTKTLEVYSAKYPSGRFAKQVASFREKGNTKKTPGKDGEKVGEESNRLMVQGILYGIIIAIFFYATIRKRRSICSFLKGQYLKFMRNVDIIDGEGVENREVKQEECQQKEGEHPEITKGDDKVTGCGSVIDDSVKEEILSPKNDLEEQGPKPETKEEPRPLDPEKFALDADEWIVVGASVQGKGHVEMNLPCQDNHAYEYIKDGWGVAITSDGAGSAKYSHIGSAASTARAMTHFKNLIEEEGWIEKNILPSDNEWMKKSYKVLKTVRDELEALAKKRKCDFKDLSATIIVVIHSPLGILVVHIGDGRAGYKDNRGAWHSLITPHKGEEANQTIFIPSDFWNHPFYEISGVTVPESRVVRDSVTAFTLMSDGCEGATWLCNQRNETTGRYYDPNLPHDKFFDSCLETLRTFRKGNTPFDERKTKWYQFIKDGNKKFEKETDDKTIILGTLYT